MPPPALAYLYCSEADLEAILSVDGKIGSVDDDNDASESAIEKTYIDAAINWGTDRVNFYCLARYAAADLANSWIVNHWTVICAAKWLSSRRGNPPPASIDDLYEDALKDMEMVRKGDAQVPGMGLRTAAWPAWSNIRVDQLYTLRKIRVERPISEQSPVKDYHQQQDIAANFIIEP